MSIFDLIARLFGRLSKPPDWSVAGHTDSRTFVGEFVVFDRKGRIRVRVKGRIVEWPRLAAQVYVFDPPSFVQKHPVGRCLQLLHPGDKWFKLHFNKPARDFPSAYGYVENFLTEAYYIQS